MIYLFTGNMGTGKTSRVVHMMMTNEDGLFKTEAEDGTVIDRPIYFCHIDGLDAKKFHAHELTREQIQSAPLDELLPEGGVLIVDEAHWTYPVRSSASKVPEYIQKLSELRHDGFTLILMTQHPTQIDVFVRNLVSKHVHIERKALGMKQYWWYKCVTNLDNPAAIAGTESSDWKPPKDAFKYYKSASKHQKFVKKLPKAVYLLAIILCLVVWKGYSVCQNYDKNVNRTEQLTTIEQSAASEPFSTTYNNTNITHNNIFERTGQSITPDMLVPTIPEKPETKPLYDNVRQVKTFERVAFCMKGLKSGCGCFSQQGTRLLEISRERCLKYVDEGLPFNPYKDENQQEDFRQFEQVEVQQQTQTQTAQVYQLGGEPKFQKSEANDNLRNIQ